MMVESQSKLCLVEKKNEKKEQEMKIKLHGRTLNKIKRLLKSCQGKIVLLVLRMEMVFTSYAFREMGNVLLSQARKC